MAGRNVLHWPPCFPSCPPVVHSLQGSQSELLKHGSNQTLLHVSASDGPLLDLPTSWASFVGTLPRSKVLSDAVLPPGPSKASNQSDPRAGALAARPLPRLLRPWPPRAGACCHSKRPSPLNIDALQPSTQFYFLHSTYQ